MNEELAQKSFGLGYIDQSGEITPDGYEAIKLQDQGIYDAEFNPTPKGKAWAMTYRESLEDPESFNIRYKEGWDDPEGDFMTRAGQGVGMVIDMLGDAVAGAIQDPAISGPLAPGFWVDREDEIKVRRAEALRSASVASNFWVSGGKDLLAMPFRDEDEEIEAKRLRALVEAEVNESQVSSIAAEVLGPVGDLAKVEAAITEAELTIPEERREVLKAQGAGMGEFLNPGDCEQED